MATDPVSIISAREIVELYGAAWEEHCDDARRELVERVWATDGVYCDPSARVEGRAALVAHIGGFQTRWPDHRIVMMTGVDEHDEWLRFGWLMLAPDDEVVLEGMDVAERDVDGRIRRIVGFFGPIPSPEAMF
jgi:hypothetical protein